MSCEQNEKENGCNGAHASAYKDVYRVCHKPQRYYFNRILVCVDVENVRSNTQMDQSLASYTRTRTRLHPPPQNHQFMRPNFQKNSYLIARAHTLLKLIKMKLYRLILKANNLD